MGSYKIADVAALLNVSDDTVRRWISDGHLTVDDTTPGPKRVTATSLVELITTNPAWQAYSDKAHTHSIRNQLRGIITRIVSDTVMTQVEMTCGHHRIVSLISTEAATELNLTVGDVAYAQVKSTNVSVIKELP